MPPDYESSSSNSEGGAARGGGGGCFVATVAYGAADCEEVAALRALRDAVLVRTAAGRCFIRVYYRWGPIAARHVERRSLLRHIVVQALRPLVWVSRVITVTKHDRLQ